MRDRLMLAAGLLLLSGATSAACVDNVVMVHGNTGSPTDFNDTWNTLVGRGYTSAQLFRPSWGSKTCAACNDHSGSEETPVESAIRSAITSSCTGRIDVIGHSMGVTLAARVLQRTGLTGKVESFVGIAGGWRGLWSCGTYPFNVVTSTCGYYGLSVSSPLLNSLAAGARVGSRITSIKSYIDQVVCATGVCTVGGVHSSTITGENSTVTLNLGHFGLLYSTPTLQADLIR
jgi:triacylglycerol lipase